MKCRLALSISLSCLTVFAQKPELVVPTGHGLGVNAIAFSPDGRLIASASLDNTLKLWDAGSGRELRTLSHSQAVSSVAFSADGRTLASGSWDHTLKLWDADSGRELRTLLGHGDRVTSVAFSPDGHTLASGSEDTTVKLWDANSGRLLRTLAGHSRAVESVAFSPDGHTLASGGDDKTIRVWDVNTGRAFEKLDGHLQPVYSVAFSPDGRILASGSEDRTIKLWDTRTGRVLRTLSQHRLGVSCVAFKPDGRTLASGSWDHTIKLWDVERAGNPRTLTINAPPDAPVLSFVGLPVAFSPNGLVLASGSGERFNGTVKMWDAGSGREIHPLTGHAFIVGTVAFSPGGRAVAFGSFDKTVKLWDLSGRELRVLTGHSDFVQSVAFSRDGGTLASGSDDKTIKLWDANNGRELRTLAGHTDKVFTVAFSRDGRTLASGSWDHTVKLWDALSGRELRTLVGHADKVIFVTFSPDGRMLASGSYDKTVKVWDVDSGRELRTLTSPGFGAVTSVAFSPDGKTLASIDTSGSVRLWEASSGRPLPTLESGSSPSDLEHHFVSGDIAFSPDGHILAHSKWDNTVRLLDVATGKELAALDGHSNAESLAFSPDGHTLAAASLDQTVRLWEVRSGRELARLVALEQNDWAVVDSQGRFDASPGGMDLMYWVVGLETIDLSQLKERYYEPGLLAKAAGFNKEPVRDVQSFTEVKLFPEVTLTPPDAQNPKLGIHLANRGGGIGRVEVLINGKEIAADARGPAVDGNAQQIDLSVNVANHPLLQPGQENVLEVKAYNGEGYLISRGLKAIYTPPGEKAVAPPDFWAIVAGSSDYAGEGIRLRFAAKDAESMAGALRVAGERLFGKAKTHIALLTTDHVAGAALPTRDNLKKAFAAAHQAKPGDVLVVYLSGHGVNLASQGGEADYYYLTQEARTGDLTDPEVRRQTSLSSRELTEWVRDVPATKQVLVLDTCAAGELVAKLSEKRDIAASQVRALDRMKDRMGMYVLAGSAADAVSYEASRYGQGLLTYSLLLAMRGAALREEQYVDVFKWFGFAENQVPQLAKDIGGIQRPMKLLPSDGKSFDVGMIVGEDKDRIHVENPRPMFLQSNFQDEIRMVDHLKLALRVNESLRDASARERAAALVFVNALEFPDAYQLAGRYRIDPNSAKVTVTVNLVKGENTAGNFTVEGSAADIDKLAARIVAEAERLLQGLP